MAMWYSYYDGIYNIIWVISQNHNINHYKIPLFLSLYSIADLYLIVNLYLIAYLYIISLY